MVWRPSSLTCQGQQRPWGWWRVGMLACCCRTRWRAASSPRSDGHLQQHSSFQHPERPQASSAAPKRTLGQLVAADMWRGGPILALWQGGVAAAGRCSACTGLGEQGIGRRDCSSERHALGGLERSAGLSFCGSRSAGAGAGDVAAVQVTCRLTMCLEPGLLSAFLAVGPASHSGQPWQSVRAASCSLAFHAPEAEPEALFLCRDELMGV